MTIKYDECGGKIERLKFAKKVKGRKLCKKCYRKNLKEHRKETLENSPDKAKIRELENQERREYYRKAAERKRQTQAQPQIKGSKPECKKTTTNSYISLQEKQNFLRILVRRGVDFEEAKERISNLIKQQAITRKKMKEQNKSEEEIRIKQQELLEELWRY